ncbi:MAG: hypothetical protein WCF50_22960, partial [Pseudolabrys sp.]
MIGFEVLLVALIVLGRGGHCTHMACNVAAKDPGLFDSHETFANGRWLVLSTLACSYVKHEQLFTAISEIFHYLAIA